MKAVILAGGRGKRLKSITDYIPKPLVPVKNRPIIEWQIKYLKRFGVSEVIVCGGYKSEMIQNYLGKSRMGIKIRYSIEEKPLGTGGAIKKAGRMIREKSFFAINGDVITDLDLRKLARIPNSIAAIELRTKFGIMETDQEKVVKFKEKKEIPDLWMNSGIYHLDRKILADLPSKGDLEKTVFPQYAKNKEIHTVKFKNVRWFSVDSLKDVEDIAFEVEDIIK